MIDAMVLDLFAVFSEIGARKLDHAEAVSAIRFVVEKYNGGLDDRFDDARLVEQRACSSNGKSGMTEPFKRIKLTQGLFALVSPEDFDELNQYKWYASKSRGRFYALRKLKRVPGKRPSEFMHRRILNPAPGEHCDHINGDGLDNRRSNLRIANRSQNQMNRGMQKNNTSGFKGVTSSGNRWCAYIRCGGVSRNLGMFDSPEEAARAYDRRALELHGEFAKLNFEVKGGASGR